MKYSNSYHTADNILIKYSAFFRVTYENISMLENIELALTEDTALLLIVNNDGHRVEKYSIQHFEVDNFTGCFSFKLQSGVYFCARECVYGFNKGKHKWEKLNTSMSTIRHGTAFVSLEVNTIITGREESDDVV